MPKIALHRATEQGAPRRDAARCRASWRGLVTAVLVAGSVVVGSLGPGAQPALAQGTPAPGDSPLRRREAPADGVQAQLNLGSIGAADLWCSFGPNGVTNRDGAGDCTLGAGVPLSLRFPGLTPGSDLTVQVTPPSGAPQQATVRANGEGTAQWDWISQPSDALGAYLVSATQADRQVSGVFVVRQAAGPQIMTLLDSGPAGPTYAAPVGPPGTAFGVVLSGFLPGQAVPLRLYRAVGGTYLFVTNLGAVPMNERGAATYTLQTTAGDPEGTYLVISDPRAAGPGLLGGEVRVSSRADRPALDADADTNALALALVEQANQIFARVVARGGPAVSDLENAFAGAPLDAARGAVEQMRGQGMYREARLTAPITLQSARRSQDGATPRLEAVVSEQWDDRMFNRDGSLIGTLPSRLQQRYVFELRSQPGQLCQSCWLIVDTQLLGQQ
jgi:hypothetical protein